MKNPKRNALLAVAILGLATWTIVDKSDGDGSGGGSRERGHRVEARIDVSGAPDAVRRFVERQQREHGDLKVVQLKIGGPEGAAVLAFDDDDLADVTGAAKADGLKFSATID